MDTGPSSAKFFTLAVGCLITTFPFFLSTGGAGFACTGATFTAPLAPSTRAAVVKDNASCFPKSNAPGLGLLLLALLPLLALVCFPLASVSALVPPGVFLVLWLASSFSFLAVVIVFNVMAAPPLRYRSGRVESGRV